MKFTGKLFESDLKEKTTAQRQLLEWEPQHDFLCCFDVDGHLLDNMLAKQVIVFQPHFMDIFGLRDIETYYRLHGEYHNLWGPDRGCDRHEAKALILDSLMSDPELSVKIDDGMCNKIAAIKESLDKYIEHIESTGDAYGFDSLHRFALAYPGDENLTKLMAWSKACDLTFPFVTIPMPPFGKVVDTLSFVSSRADVLIVSKTPYDDICNWLEAHELIQYVTAIAGKEQGAKDEHICLAMGGKYDAATKAIVETGSNYLPEKVIMGGDGRGDLKAAKKNHAYFFPTPAGREQEAWNEAKDMVFGAFFDGRYASVEPVRVEEFKSAAQPVPVWEQSGYENKAEYAKLQPKRRHLYHQLNPGGKLAG